MIVTIACPISMTHDGVNPSVAPIWFDSQGNKYYVASGIIDGCVETEHKKAVPDLVTVIFGLEGLETLSEMGLKPAEIVL